MAFTPSVLRLMARACRREPFVDSILTLGKQGVYATHAKIEQMYREEGLTPHPLPHGLEPFPDVPSFRTGPFQHFTNDRAALFAMSGLIPTALDVSDYEQAEMIQDLNVPVPESLHERFGVIVDGGTMEHIFDVPQVLENISRMLRVGGRVFHVNPVSNWVDHGFYQFSPTLYFDYYRRNGLTVVGAVLFETTRVNADCGYARGCKAWAWNPERPNVPLVSSEMLTLFVEVRKTHPFTTPVSPQQGESSGSLDNSRLVSRQAQSYTLLRRVKSKFLRMSPYTGALVSIARRALGLDLSRKPWGLRYLGRI